MMQITPTDRLGFQRDLAITRNDSRLVYALVPDMSRPAFDVETQSAINPSSGDGLGELVTNWIIYALHGNIRQVDTALKTFGNIPPGVEVGDVLLSVGLRDKSALQQVMDEQNAYILIDGGTFRPENLHVAGVGQIEEWTADLKAFKPAYRKHGY